MSREYVQRVLSRTWAFLPLRLVLRVPAVVYVPTATTVRNVPLGRSRYSGIG